MMKLLCEENNLEYTGSGYLQCGRHVECPKKKNNKILGFDCLVYMDNLPNGCKIDVDISVLEKDDDLIHINVVPAINKDNHIVANKNGHSPAIQIIPASEQVTHG